MISLLFALFVLCAEPAVAAPTAPETYVWADGRFSVHSPQYYTSTTADLSASLRANTTYGAKVRVRYGFGGFKDGVNGEWLDQHEVDALAVGPWEWRADFSEVLHERSWNGAYTKLEFVFIITAPDGSVRFEKGSDSVWGFYEAALPEPGTIGNGGNAAFQRLTVYTVLRN